MEGWLGTDCDFGKISNELSLDFRLTLSSINVKGNLLQGTDTVTIQILIREL